MKTSLTSAENIYARHGTTLIYITHLYGFHLQFCLQLKMSSSQRYAHNKSRKLHTIDARITMTIDGALFAEGRLRWRTNRRASYKSYCQLLAEKDASGEHGADSRRSGKHTATGIGNLRRTMRLGNAWAHVTHEVTSQRGNADFTVDIRYAQSSTKPISRAGLLLKKLVLGQRSKHLFRLQESQ